MTAPIPLSRARNMVRTGHSLASVAALMHVSSKTLVRHLAKDPKTPFRSTAPDGVVFLYSATGQVTEKYCSGCDRYREARAFAVNRSARHGLQSRCRLCVATARTKPVT